MSAERIHTISDVIKRITPHLNVVIEDIFRGRVTNIGIWEHIAVAYPEYELQIKKMVGMLIKANEALDDLLLNDEELDQWNGFNDREDGFLFARGRVSYAKTSKDNNDCTRNLLAAVYLSRLRAKGMQFKPSVEEGAEADALLFIVKEYLTDKHISVEDIIKLILEEKLPIPDVE